MISEFCAIVALLASFGQIASIPMMPRVDVVAIYAGSHQEQSGYAGNIPIYGFTARDFTLEVTIHTPIANEFRPSLYRLVCVWKVGGTMIQQFDSTTVRKTSDTTLVFAGPFTAHDQDEMDVFLVWGEDYQKLERWTLIEALKTGDSVLHSSNRCKVLLPRRSRESK